MSPLPVPILTARLEDLRERVGEIDLEILEDTGLGRVDPVLVQTATSILEEAEDLLQQVVESPTTSEGEEAARGPGVETVPPEASDLAFLGGRELGDLRRALAAADESGQAWRVLSLADRALERVERAVGEVLRLMSPELTGPAPRAGLSPDLAVEIRRQYAVLRYGLEREGMPAGEALLDALARAGARIDRLRRRPIYPRLRIDDRRQLHRLRKRIVTAVEGEGLPERECVALWEDLVSSVRLFMGINNREALRSHDEALIRNAVEKLQQGAERDVRAASLLEPLLGRDPELDRRLLDYQQPTADEVRQPLERLRERLGPRPGGPSS